MRSIVVFTYGLRRVFGPFFSIELQNSDIYVFKIEIISSESMIEECILIK
jgi:hypothetical protein